MRGLSAHPHACCVGAERSWQAQSLHEHLHCAGQEPAGVLVYLGKRRRCQRPGLPQLRGNLWPKELCLFLRMRPGRYEDHKNW